MHAFSCFLLAWEKTKTKTSVDEVNRHQVEVCFRKQRNPPRPARVPCQGPKYRLALYIYIYMYIYICVSYKSYNVASQKTSVNSEVGVKVESLQSICFNMNQYKSAQSWVKLHVHAPWAPCLWGWVLSGFWHLTFGQCLGKPFTVWQIGILMHFVCRSHFQHNLADFMSGVGGESCWKRPANPPGNRRDMHLRTLVLAPCRRGRLADFKCRVPKSAGLGAIKE